jgi:hypothetical protein
VSSGYGRSKEVDSRALSLLGTQDLSVVAAATNAPDGGRVNVDYKQYRDGSSRVTVDSGGDGVTSNCSFERDPEEGSLVAHTDLFILDDELADGSPNPWKGKGTEMVANQIAALRKLGAARSELFAARSNSMNGYYTWPRLGYDGPLSRSVLESMSMNDADHLRGRLPKRGATIQDLFALPGGKEYWKEHGDSIDLSFDLRDGSKSLLVLQAYLEERAGRKKEGGGGAQQQQQQHARPGSLAIRFRRLAEAARLSGDRHSASIYMRQARGEF